jgi:replicative DNA helicase
MQPAFLAAPSRAAGERERRLAMANRALRYHHGYLDEHLRGIRPHDLVLIGAETGAGKTELAISIAKANARAGKRVHLFALEAEPDEAERRIKYSLLCGLAAKAGNERAAELTYADWMFGRCEDIVAPYEADAERIMRERYATLRTYYRGEAFGTADVERLFKAVAGDTDLIVLDHAHFLDLADDESEHRGFARAVKTIRTTALEIGKPVIVIAHLRKRDLRAKQLVPHLEDFSGSSELIKQVTHAIPLAPARDVEAKWYEAPTYITVAKDRPAGATGLVALCTFDRRSRQYLPQYGLGRMVDGGTRFEALKPQDFPRWAKSARAMEAA